MGPHHEAACTLQGILQGSKALYICAPRGSCQDQAGSPAPQATDRVLGSLLTAPLHLYQPHVHARGSFRVVVTPPCAAEHGRAAHQQQVPAADAVPATADPAARQDQVQQHQQRLPGLRPIRHMHSHSETDLQELRHQVEQMQEAPALIRLDSDDGQQPGVATDWAAFDDPPAKAAAAAAAGSSRSPAAADDSSSLHQKLPAIASSSSSALAAGAAAAGSSSSSAMAAGAAAGSSSGGAGDSSAAAPAAEPKFEVPSSTSVFDTGEEVPDHDHTQEKRELIIYAIPLTRGKVG